MTDGLRIQAVEITPVAFRDPALLNAVGVHEPYALRAIVEVRHRRGPHRPRRDLCRRRPSAPAAGRRGRHHRNGRVRARRHAPQGRRSPRWDSGVGGSGLTGMITTSSAVDRVFSPFEVACLDLQGKAAGRPVSDLLGGSGPRLRAVQRVSLLQVGRAPGTAEPRRLGRGPRPGRHRRAGAPDDRPSTASAPSSSRAVSSRPTEEIAAIRALREAFPDVPLRLDPNAAWSGGDLARGGPRTRRRPRVPGGPDARHARHGGGRRARTADAAGHQHVRGRLRASAARGRARRGAGGAVRPPLLGRPAPHPAARRHLRDLRHRACPCTPTPTWASAWPR